MHNIVDFRSGRSRPRRSAEVPQAGAQILLFTGVRYVREPAETPPPFVPDGAPFCEATALEAPGLIAAGIDSAVSLDCTAH